MRLSSVLVYSVVFNCVTSTECGVDNKHVDLYRSQFLTAGTTELVML